jgi:hypothetical protein
LNSIYYRLGSVSYYLDEAFIVHPRLRYTKNVDLINLMRLKFRPDYIFPSPNCLVFGVIKSAALD